MMKSGSALLGGYYAREVLKIDRSDPLLLLCANDQFWCFPQERFADATLVPENHSTRQEDCQVWSPRSVAQFEGALCRFSALIYFRNQVRIKKSAEWSWNYPFNEFSQKDSLFLLQKYFALVYQVGVFLFTNKNFNNCGKVTHQLTPKDNLCV